MADLVPRGRDPRWLFEKITVCSFTCLRLRRGIGVSLAWQAARGRKRTPQGLKGLLSIAELAGVRRMPRTGCGPTKQASEMEKPSLMAEAGGVLNHLRTA